VRLAPRSCPPGEGHEPARGCPPDGSYRVIRYLDYEQQVGDYEQQVGDYEQQVGDHEQQVRDHERQVGAYRTTSPTPRRSALDRMRSPGESADIESHYIGNPDIENRGVATLRLMT
jgi:hypothetical protein